MLHWSRKLIIAGISGFACGNAYSQAKKHPTIVIPMLEGAVLAGACGSLLGAGVSIYRKLPGHVYAISLGANFAITTLSFLGLRQLMLTQSDRVYLMTTQPMITNHTDFLASSASGGMTASLISVLSWKGLSSLFKASIMGIISGLTVQYIHNNVFEQWRKRKALELMYPELTKTDPQNAWSLRNFQKSWLQFWYKQSNAAVIEQDILLLEDLIRQEREKLELSNKELGENVEVTMTSVAKPEYRTTIT